MSFSRKFVEENRGGIQYEKSVPVAKRTGAPANERSSFLQVGREGRRETRNVEKRRGGRGETKIKGANGQESEGKDKTETEMRKQLRA